MTPTASAAGPQTTTIDPLRVKLSGLWVALMLTYLLGDVLRIYSGDFVPGEVGGKEVGQGAWLVAAVMMVVPILMIVLTLFLDGQVDRWANVSVAVAFFALNAVGLPGYPGAYDKFLIVVGLALNCVTAWQAWRWR